VKLRSPDLEIVYLSAQKALEGIEPSARDTIASLVANHTCEFQPHAALSQGDEQIVEQLRRKGAAPLGRMLTEAQCRQIAGRFTNLPCFGNHISTHSDGVRRPIEEIRKLSPYGSYTLADALAVPELFHLATNPRTMGIADSYLGCMPSVYSIHVFWTFGKLEQPGHTHSYHRDFDDFRFLSLFIYLTDVDIGDGPLHFIDGTHSIAAARSVLEKVNEARHHRGENPIDALDYFPPRSIDGDVPGAPADTVFAESIEAFTGPAGSTFIADTYGLHRGSIPGTRDRLVCWIRYGMTQNLGYMRAHTAQVPIQELPYLAPTEQIPWAYRLVLK
jgi:hypothetical protein